MHIRGYFEISHEEKNNFVKKIISSQNNETFEEFLGYFNLGSKIGSFKGFFSIVIAANKIGWKITGWIFMFRL